MAMGKIFPKLGIFVARSSLLVGNPNEFKSTLIFELRQIQFISHMSLNAVHDSEAFPRALARIIAPPARPPRPTYVTSAPSSRIIIQPKQDFLGILLSPYYRDQLKGRP